MKRRAHSWLQLVAQAGRYNSASWCRKHSQAIKVLARWCTISWRGGHRRSFVRCALLGDWCGVNSNVQCIYTGQVCESFLSSNFVRLSVGNGLCLVYRICTTELGQLCQTHLLSACIFFAVLTLFLIVAAAGALTDLPASKFFHCKGFLRGSWCTGPIRCCWIVLVFLAMNTYFILLSWQLRRTTSSCASLLMFCIEVEARGYISWE
jgi:hypothetical protein